MSTEWIGFKRKNWPEGSKERVLVRDYPGCKTIWEAVRKVKEKALGVSQVGKAGAFEAPISGSSPEPPANSLLASSSMAEHLAVNQAVDCSSQSLPAILEDPPW